MEFSLTPDPSIDSIQRLFRQTFTASEGAEEGELIGELAYQLLDQTSTEDIHVFIATEQTQLIGCIIFTRLRFDTEINALLMAPVATLTEFQGQGIGQQLIHFALKQLQQHGVELVVTYGDPKFYAKVGFQPVSQTKIRPPYQLMFPHGWQAQMLTDADIPTLAGTTSCVAAFNKPELW